MTLKGSASPKRIAMDGAPTPELEDGYQLKLTHGKYMLEYGGASHYLCRNMEPQSFFIKDIANTLIKNLKRRERMATWKAML